MFQIMRLTLILTVLSIVQVAGSTYSQSLELTIRLKNVEVEEVFKEIMNQSEMDFFYNVDVLEGLSKVDVRVKKAKLEDLLKTILPDHLIYEIIDRTIIIKKNPNFKPKIPAPEDIDISGKINDESGQGLPGASIVVKGTTNGTVSDADGAFRLTVPENSTLIFSYVGYKTTEMLIGNQTVLNIQMVLDAEQLDELVVVSYGSQKEREVTGSIAAIDMDQLSDQNVGQAVQKIQGQLPGVQINQANGVPGQETAIRIRGAASLNAGNSSIICYRWFSG